MKKTLIFIFGILLAGICNGQWTPFYFDGVVWPEDYGCNNFSTETIGWPGPIWSATHGSPTTTDHGIDYAQLSVNSYGEGEGIVASYNFEGDHTYDIWFITTNNASIYLDIYMANGVSTGSTSDCSMEYTPGVSDKQLIATSTTSEQRTITIDPNKDYSQIWFYTEGLSGSMEIEFLSIHDNGPIYTGPCCPNGLTINGNSMTSNQVSGDATISNSHTTTSSSIELKVGNSIQINSTSILKVNGTGSLTLSIEDCPYSSCKVASKPLNSDPNNSFTDKAGNQLIYPNPFTSELNVNVNSDEVKIYNLTGNQVYKGEPGIINMSEQVEGMYIISWEEEGETKMEKVVLSK